MMVLIRSDKGAKDCEEEWCVTTGDSVTSRHDPASCGQHGHWQWLNIYSTLTHSAWIWSMELWSIKGTLSHLIYCNLEDDPINIPNLPRP